MVIGVDFDNTIVRYDELFHRIAVERGLIPASVPARKKAVRDALRRQGGERQWTELQGQAYGPGMAEAQPFPGVVEFFSRAVRSGIPIYVISHKTKVPAVGPAYDLHQSARDWLKATGFLDSARIGLSPEHVYFGTTRREKLAIIRQQGCTHFIDDLEETFYEKEFPSGVAKILFGHDHRPEGLDDVIPAADWAQVTNYVFGNAN